MSCCCSIPQLNNLGVTQYMQLLHLQRHSSQGTDAREHADTHIKVHKYTHVYVITLTHAHTETKTASKIFNSQWTSLSVAHCVTVSGFYGLWPVVLQSVDFIVSGPLCNSEWIS